LQVKAELMHFLQTAISVYVLAMICACTNPNDSGNHRGMSMAQGTQQGTTTTIQINASIPNHEAIQTALEEELGKADAGENVRVQIVQGSPVSERYVVEMRNNIPPSILMRLKKVLRTQSGSAQPTFRSLDGEAPNRIYVGKSS
jgi:hypothetical protein